MSSDRLKELQRQRALAQEHLAWFDREIARESADQAVTPTIAQEVPVTQPVAAPAPVADVEAEKILERYRHAGHPVKNEVRRGCFLYFFAAFALLGLGIVVFYFLWRR